jgi:hypothetical protein
MQMEDMGIPSAHGSEMGNHLYRRAAEERKPVKIIGIVDAVILVQPRTIEEGLVPNRPHPHSAITCAYGDDVFFNQRLYKSLRRRHMQPTDGTEGSA